MLQGQHLPSSLVTAATMMPVAELPAASWHTAMGLGFVSAVFDNIRSRRSRSSRAGTTGATRLRGRLRRIDDLVRVFRGGRPVEYVSGAKSVGRWLVHGWHVTLAYVIGFFVLLFVMGWHPNAPHRPAPPRRTSSGLRSRPQGFALRKPARSSCHVHGKT